MVRRVETVLVPQWAGAFLVPRWKPGFLVDTGYFCLCLRRAFLVPRWKPGFLGEHRVLALLKERPVEPFSAER